MLLDVVVGLPNVVVIYLRHNLITLIVGRACRGHTRNDCRLLVPPGAHGLMCRPLISVMSETVMTRSQTRTEFTIAS